MNQQWAISVFIMFNLYHEKRPKMSGENRQGGDEGGQRGGEIETVAKYLHAARLLKRE